MTITIEQLLDTIHPTFSSSFSTLLAYGVLFLLFVYYSLHYLDFPILPISELAWCGLVYITPSQLISFLPPSSNLAVHQQEGIDRLIARSVGWARKSEAMRHVLGFDGTGVMSNVQTARSSSSIDSITKGTPSMAPPGLGNWDNSCYQNSILQGVAAIRSLPQYLARNTQAEGIYSTKAALRDLLARLSDPASAGKMLWTPAELKSMSSWQQQDAQEYFSKVLDEVEKEDAKSTNAALRDVGLAAPATLKLESWDTQPEPSSASTEGIVSPDAQRILQLPDELACVVARNPLEGLLAQRVGCLRCGYVEGLSLIPFNCLTVPLGQQWIYDIRSCMDEYTGLESIHGVECAKCTLLHAQEQLDRLLAQIEGQHCGDANQTLPSMLKGLKDSTNNRLVAVNSALDEEDFPDNTLLKKCQINAKSRVSTTKSRQAIIARAPKSLVIHVNRSVFDEFSGAQTKNFANVRFPYRFDIGSWCLGGGNPVASNEEAIEHWITDPAMSMLSSEIEDVSKHLQHAYELRAVITHYDRHENGHYICFRKHPLPEPSQSTPTDHSKEPWWRLSDDEVSQVTEDSVLSQGGVFMLFYEQVEQPPAFVEMDANEATEPEQKLAKVLKNKHRIRR